jgi:hypothetical protein
MNSQPNSLSWRLKPAYILAVVMLIGALFLITPQGVTFAQNILRFFIHSQGNTLPGPDLGPVKWIPQTPGVSAATSTPPYSSPIFAFSEDCGPDDNPVCSLEQIRAKVSFPVFQPANVPNGLDFIGATGDSQRVHIVYKAQKNWNGWLVIDEEPWINSPNQKAWEVGASADIQTIRVGNVTAEYVKGAYFSDGSREPYKWNSDFDQQSLRWIDQGILFNLQFLGSEPRMGRDELTALISIMTANPLADVTPAPTPGPTEDLVALLKGRFALTIDQAAKEAGFSLHLPSQLPEGLAFIGARYEADHKKVMVFYNYSNHGINGLSLHMQTVPDSKECALCGFQFSAETHLNETPPETMIGKEAKVETVPIGEGQGEYVEGAWMGTEQGWQWDSTPYHKQLRWWVNNIAYELEYQGMELTKEDMIAIAASMK